MLKSKIPKHKLLVFAAAVEKTHAGLGAVTAFSHVCVKARRSLLVVAVAGTGKSTAIKHAAESQKDGHIAIGSLTRSGLTRMSNDLNDSKRCIMVDDLGAVDTGYSRLETLNTMINLVYNHEITKVNSTLNLSIHDFNGSFITTVQPVKMQDIVGTSMWEAVIRDKLIRYYHLIRPTTPVDKPIEAKLNQGISILKVKKTLPKSDKLSACFEIAYSQWGKARSLQHVTAMLKACASFEDRTRILPKDVLVLWYLMQPMKLEPYFIVKEGFESKKTFQNNHMCMLTEFASYPNLSLTDIMHDFHVKEKTARDLIFRLRRYGNNAP